jgi:hypothetical protein
MTMFTYEIYRQRSDGRLEWASGANTESWARVTANLMSMDERATTVVMRTYPDHSTRVLYTFSCGDRAVPQAVPSHVIAAAAGKRA